jgi:hypothetical protein
MRSPLLELLDEGVALGLVQVEPEGMPRHAARAVRVQKLAQANGPSEMCEPGALAHPI